MMTDRKYSTAQGPPKPPPAVQRVATLGDAVLAADAMQEQESKADLAMDPAEVYDQMTEAFTAGHVMSQVMGRLQADNEQKDALNRELIFMHTQLAGLVEKLKHAVMATGGTNFAGLLQLSDQVAGQCTQIFANAMLARYRTPGGGTETDGGTEAVPAKAECKLCEGDGIPDIDEHGKKCLRKCPECGAHNPPEAETQEDDDEDVDVFTPTEGFPRPEVPVVDLTDVDIGTQDDNKDESVVTPTEADRQAVADQMADDPVSIERTGGIVTP